MKINKAKETMGAKERTRRTFAHEKLTGLPSVMIITRGFTAG
jgi:hypothetical protein